MRQVYVIGRDRLPEEFILREGESLELSLAVLPGVSCEERLKVDLTSPGASADIRGLYLCFGDERVRIDVDLKHSSGGCTSRQLFKGLVGGSAHASFHGRILVLRDAQKTKAYQENHTILLSTGAVCESRPQLEIYADDVECSHGATTGYLDPEALFYMRSRGIPEAEARRLQMVSFISPVLEGLPEALQEEVLRGLDGELFMGGSAGAGFAAESGLPSGVDSKDAER